MEKVILVDGNNLMFRSYYATAFNGNIMHNSKGFPTNALLGFVNMINKIITEENPKYIMVAFDIGKTFRHEKYDKYKDGRKETPEELKVQFPIIKKILTAMGIKYLECEGYEADDIIGTISLWCDNNPEYEALIVSSDKDLLQLISDETTVKLLKPKDYIMMDKKTFIDTYGFEPIKMIDLKALMGDSSDNIPGVKGIGEKTAIKLLCQYGSLDDIYNNIDSIKGATHDKLVDGKDDAYYSKELVTIYREVPLNITFDDLLYSKSDYNTLMEIYRKLEFKSLMKKASTNVAFDKVNTDNFVKITNINDVVIEEATAVYLDTTFENYHNAKLLGIGLYNSKIACYIPFDLLKDNTNILDNELIKYTYDYKKLYVVLSRYNFMIPNITFDTMIAGYLLNYEIRDEISYLAQSLNFEIPFYDKKVVLTDKEQVDRAILKAKFVYDTKDKLYNDMEKDNLLDLFNNIEMPLSSVLARMELEGIIADKNVLLEMKDEIKIKLELVTKDIYNYAGEEFNINSTKKLGEILFEKLGLPHAKKNKTGYVTDMDVLKKLTDYPIVNKILEYRALSKLYSTYIEGIITSIHDDGKIHTIYTQTLTRTGRLSSIEPNLQNIPVRSEYGKLVRKAFLPDKNAVIMSADYSQIELRVFAHLSKVDKLINAFNNDIDIHTKTAMDIFDVPEEGVTKNMRRQAKAVNFGILYGISSYGLAEDLGITVKEAKAFIDKYFDTYSGVKDYMNREIEEAKKTGYVRTIMNRKRYINELFSTNYSVKSMGERMALNTPVQGSASDILKKAMIEIDNIFSEKKLKSKMLLQVHDELIFNVYNDELDIVKDIVYNTMTKVVKLSVPLDVDIEMGNNWYEAK